MVADIARETTPTELDSPFMGGAARVALEQLATPVSYTAMSDGNLLSLSYDENMDMSEFMQSPHSYSQHPDDGLQRTPTNYAESDVPTSAADAEEVRQTMSGRSKFTPVAGLAEDPSSSTFGRQFTATGYFPVAHA